MSSRARLQVIVSLILSWSIVACSSGGSGGQVTDAGGNGQGGGAGSGAGVGGAGGAAACNTVANAAPMIQEMNVAETQPTAFTGGTLRPGTYFLTASSVYTGPGGASGPTGVTHKQTEVVTAGAGGTFEEQLVSDSGAGVVRASFSITQFTSTTLVFMYTCATGSQLTFPYSVSTDGNTVTIATGPGHNETHTRQP